jgi:hypothetical protein
MGSGDRKCRPLKIEGPTPLYIASSALGVWLCNPLYQKVADESASANFLGTIPSDCAANTNRPDSNGKL